MPWTILATNSSAVLFLLKVSSHPLLLVKVSLLPGVIGIVARRFIDGVELYSMMMPLPFLEPVSFFIAKPLVEAKTLSHGAQIYLLVGTSCGGLYSRILTIKELLNGFIADKNEEQQVRFWAVHLYRCF